MSDKLDMAYINSLPQPFIAHFYGGSEWPVWDIDVETGLLRIDVVGMLDVCRISEVKFFRDACWNDHDPEDFYLGAIRGHVIAPATTQAVAAVRFVKFASQWGPKAAERFVEKNAIPLHLLLCVAKFEARRKSKPMRRQLRKKPCATH